MVNLRSILRLLPSLVLGTLFFSAPLHAADLAPEGDPDHEPIPYLERYKPTFFLLGKPDTKVQVSFKVPILRKVPLFMGYSQLMMWDLFEESAPFRDLNYNPELFYRFSLDQVKHAFIDAGYEHESNGKDGSDSRSWNRAYARYQQNWSWKDKRFWVSFKAWVPMSMGDPESKLLPQRRGLWEMQIGTSDLFNHLFTVNDLILRIYGGGSSRSNPLQGGVELTYREKFTGRKLLLPFYIQVFHGYGENLLDAGDKHWGFRAGLGF